MSNCIIFSVILTGVEEAKGRTWICGKRGRCGKRDRNGERYRNGERDRNGEREVTEENAGVDGTRKERNLQKGGKVGMVEPLRVS